jgi:hypothetical protein
VSAEEAGTLLFKRESAGFGLWLCVVCVGGRCHTLPDGRWTVYHLCFAKTGCLTY